jgi:uncharacterized membrane protein HdeD (DUF308 family)
MNSLRSYYYLRAAVSFGWVALVVLFAQLHVPFALSATLLSLYPAWDAAANILDARQSGGLRANPGQRMNAITSAVTTIVLVAALIIDGTAGGVLVFGIWALLAGLFQLWVGIRRRKLGGQVFMMLSGAQSALAGVFMVIQSSTREPSIAGLAPYAAFGGLYFLLAALRLTFRTARA